MVKIVMMRRRAWVAVVAAIAFAIMCASGALAQGYFFVSPDGTDAAGETHVRTIQYALNQDVGRDCD